MEGGLSSTQNAQQGGAEAASAVLTAPGQPSPGLTPPSPPTHWGPPPCLPSPASRRTGRQQGDPAGTFRQPRSRTVGAAQRLRAARQGAPSGRGGASSEPPGGSPAPLTAGAASSQPPPSARSPPAGSPEPPAALGARPAPRASPRPAMVAAAGAAAASGRCPLRFLILAGVAAASLAKGAGAEGPAFISEYFLQSSQGLSFYSWYGNAKLFRFHVPEDTVLLRWLLQASREQGPECGEIQVTFHIRYGAPPVINPLGTQFPENTSVPPSFSQTLFLGPALQNSTFVNLSSPAAGNWFLAAHLPEASSKIEMKGFSTPCKYTFQADLFVLRRLDVVVLEPDVPTRRTLSQQPGRPLHAKVFVPGYTTGLLFELGRCRENGSAATCALQVTLGSAVLSQPSQKVLPCMEACRALLASPPWGRWVWITVESLWSAQARADVSFQMMASLTACRPGGADSFLSFYQSLKESPALPGVNLPTSLPLASGPNRNASGQGGSCLHDQPVIREDLDAASVRFRILGDPTVPVQSEPPTLLLLKLNSGLDSGGTLVLNLMLNQTSEGLGNATVLACLSASSPTLSLNDSWDCRTAFSQGHFLNVSMSFREATVIVPYPESNNWYLSLRLLCPKDSEDCDRAEGRVAILAYLTPCWDDCGTYGQCSLLRRQGYLYAGCICKAGWGGWSCTDATKAQSVGTQTLATLLLTLSNLLFLPAIATALCHFHLVEASVYAFTMFFSTFYHACDQPGVAVMCIMDYDTLQFCDFLGSVVSIWVTILCMARVEKILKYVLCVLGTLLIAMSLQLDRRGVWNMMGPCVFALGVMAGLWIYRGVTRRRCYPASRKRWAFFLLPGTSLALVAVAVYVFLETTDNYYYTHSIWHILVASSVAFLLPPGDKHQKPWAWSRKLLCRYQICKNDREELYAVS